jgi:hypothetical protein
MSKQKLLGTLVCVLSLAPAVAQANSTTGAWGPVFGFPIIPVHSVLTPDGRVMSFGTMNSGEQGANLHYAVWNPALGTGAGAHTLLPNYTPTDIFCASQLLNPVDGKAVLFGGDNSGGGNWGNPNTSSFNSTANVLQDDGFAMAYPRWYATATTLPNGEMLVQGGSSNGFAGDGILTPEIFHPTKGYRSLFGATSEFAYGNDFKRWWYPHAFVLSTGRVFNIAGPATYFLDVAGDGLLTPTGQLATTNIGATSTAAMYAPNKILQVGGGMEANGWYPGAPDGSKVATVIDLTSGAPVLTPTNPMTFSRHWATSTILPNGQVLVTGGSPQNADLGQPASTVPELWNPATGGWTQLAAETHARLYHSSAILLPDGRVLSAGGGAPGPVNNLNGQLFSPPYLYQGGALATRPAISVGPNIAYGANVAITLTAEPRTISRVTLVKTGAVTHSFNNEQRFVELSFSRSGNVLTAAVPNNAGLLTPGYYLLFVLDNAGIPSIAKIVKLAPPATVTNLVANGSFEQFPVAAGGWANYSTGQSLGSWTVSLGTISVQSNTHGGLGTKGASGNQHADLNGPPLGEMVQTITGLTPGAIYSLSYDYAIHSGAGGSANAQVRIADLNHTWKATNVGNVVWHQNTHRFTATATSHQLFLKGTGGAACCGMLIDDVSVVLAVPAPAGLVHSSFPYNGGAGAVDFNGTTSNTQIAHTAALAMGTNKLTLSARIFVDAFGDWDGIITKGINTGPYALQLYGNGLRFSANWGGGGSGGGSWDSTVPMTTGKWHHVAVTYDGAKIRFYVDGVVDPVTPSASIVFAPNTEALVLGADFPGGDEYFDGRMADVKLYNQALSADQVRGLAVYGAPANPAPVTTWSPWPAAVDFNGTTSNVPLAHTAAQNARKSITLAARVQVDAFGDWDGIITKGDGASPYALQLTATGQLRFSVNFDGPVGAFGGGYWDSWTKVPVGTWTHVAVTYDGVNVRFYFDGQLAPYQPAANLTFGMVAAPLYLGADFPGGDEYFDGRMSDVKVFDQALAPAQVRALIGL